MMFSSKNSIFFRIVVSFDIDESMNKEEFDDEDSNIDGNVSTCYNC